MPSPRDQPSQSNLVAAVVACGGGLDRAMLAGRTVLEHSVAQARATPGVGRVVVLDRDGTAGPMARGLGAEPIESSASDDAGEIDKGLIGRIGAGSSVVMLAAESPLRTLRDIASALALLRTPGVTTVESVCRVRGPLRNRDGRVHQGEMFRATGAVRVLGAGASGPGGVAMYEMDEESSLTLRAPGGLEMLGGILAHRARRDAAALVADVGMVVFDFDGVFTDNRVLVMQDGTEGVLCSRSDGFGLEMLRKTGLAIAVLSKEQNPVVAARCRKLKLECVQGIDDKLPELIRLAASRGVARDRVVYVGNDTNDLECLGWAGVPVAVADAHPRALAAAKIVLGAPGGFGAIRELCELIIGARSGGQGGSS